ncbi:hypothetical protein ABPG72_002798 [Tetrahymena utriculariae]
MTEQGVDQLIADFQKDKISVRSQFLQDYYNQQKIGKRSEFDPRDPLGPRLSSYWDQGDNVFSVTYKKLSNFTYKLFNPDTYTQHQLEEVKLQVKLNDAYIVLGAAVMSVPMIVFIPFILPRMKRAKREYFMHQFIKKSFFEKELGIEKVNQKKLRLHQMKQILKKRNEIKE